MSLASFFASESAALLATRGSFFDSPECLGWTTLSLAPAGLVGDVLVKLFPLVFEP